MSDDDPRIDPDLEARLAKARPVKGRIVSFSATVQGGSAARGRAEEEETPPPPEDE